MHLLIFEEELNMAKSFEKLKLNELFLQLSSSMNIKNDIDKKQFRGYQQTTPDIKLLISLAKELLIRMSESSIRKFPWLLKKINNDLKGSFHLLHDHRWSSEDLLYLGLVLLNPDPMNEILVKKDNLLSRNLLD